jgi:hypothetical protein
METSLLIVAENFMVIPPLLPCRVYSQFSLVPVLNVCEVAAICGPFVEQDHLCTVHNHRLFFLYRLRQERYVNVVFVLILPGRVHNTHFCSTPLKSCPYTGHLIKLCWLSPIGIVLSLHRCRNPQWRFSICTLFTCKKEYGILTFRLYRWSVRLAEIWTA